MLSAKINSIATFLEFAATARSLPSQAALDHLAHIARSATNDAINLELATVIPRRQRIDTADLASGKVSVFPVAARREAALA